MTSNCGCNRVKGPSGMWGYYQLIGAKVYIKSMPVSNFFNCQNAGDVFTIKDVFFRITLDGKAITVIELEELPGKVFTLKDLMISEIVNSNIVLPICGTFVSGTAICGLDVDKSPSYIDNIMGGISIIDDEGTLISNRKIRFVGATVEDLRTDPDDVTDISIDKLKNINGGTF